MRTTHQVALLFCAAYSLFHISRVPLLAGLSGPLRWAIVCGAVLLLALCAIPKMRVATAFLVFLCCFYALMDLLHLLLRLFGGQGAIASGFAAVYRLELLPVLLALALTLAGFLQARRLQVTTYQVSLPGYQGAPLRLALITDLHMGVAVKPGDLPRVLGRIQAQGADAILLGGDFIDESTPPACIDVLLRELPALSAPLGVYYVPGNHEYGAMHQGTLDLPAMLAQLEAGGITPLLDRAVPLGENAVLIGRNDAAGTGMHGRAPLGDLLAAAGGERPVIVLDHRPDGLDEAAALGVGLHLAGHTHNGQVFPVGVLYRTLHKYELMYGHKRWDNGFQAIVSSGAGAWGFPIRLNTRSEIVLVEIS